MPELPFNAIEPFLPLPEFDIPKEMASELEGEKVGKKMKLMINFETVEKTENDITIAVESIAVRKKRRKF